MTITIRRTICLLLLGSASAIPLALAQEPAKKADAGSGYHELGRLRAGLAFQAREEEHDSLKASLLYLQAAQAFQRAGEDEYHKALVAGVLAARPLRASWLHKGGAHAFFLAEDKQILTCDGAGDIRIWDVRTGRALRSFKAAEVQEGDTNIKGAVLSRDRSRLLFWTWYTVQLWNIAEGKLLQSWKLDVGPLGAAFLHKEQEVLVWWREPPVRLFDVATGKELRTFAKGANSWIAPLLDRHEKRMLTTDGKNVYLWDVAKGELLHTFSTDVKDTFLSAAFAPAEDAVAVFGYRHGSTRLFDVATGRERKSFTVERPKQFAHRVDSVVFSNNGKRLLTSSEREATRLWNVADGALLHTFLAEGGVRPQAAFSPDEKYVLTLGDPSILWDAGDGSARMRLPAAEKGYFLKGGTQLLLFGAQAELWNYASHAPPRLFGPAPEARFNDDGSLLLTGGDMVRLWDLRQSDGARERSAAALQPGSQLFRHGDAVVAALLSRDEKRLLTCGDLGDALLWDTIKGERLRSFEHGSVGRGAIFSPDETRILTWGGPTAKLWQAGNGEVVRTLKNSADLRGCVFSADGKRLLTWDVDYTARWWDTERGEALHKFEHDRDLFGARLDQKAAHALTWSLDGTAKKWDVRSGKLVWSLKHDGPVFGAAFTAKEERVWTWSGQGLHEWDNKTGKALRLLPIKGGVAAAVLDRDGKHFLLRNAQGAIQYADSSTGKVLATFHHVFNVYGFYESVSAGVFSPDATRAATWAGDGSIHLWDLASGLKLKSFRHTKAVRGVAFTREGKRILSWSADGTVRLWDADAPRPLSPDDQLLEVEVRSGLHLDEHGKVQNLTAEEWQERRKKLETVLRKPPRD